MRRKTKSQSFLFNYQSLVAVNKGLKEETWRRIYLGSVSVHHNEEAMAAFSIHRNGMRPRSWYIRKQCAWASIRNCNYYQVPLSEATPFHQPDHSLKGSNMTSWESNVQTHESVLEILYTNFNCYLASYNRVLIFFFSIYAFSILKRKRRIHTRERKKEKEREEGEKIRREEGRTGEKGMKGGREEKNKVEVVLS